MIGDILQSQGQEKSGVPAQGSLRTPKQPPSGKNGQDAPQSAALQAHGAIAVAKSSSAIVQQAGSLHCGHGDRFVQLPAQQKPLRPNHPGLQETARLTTERPQQSQAYQQLSAHQARQPRLSEGHGSNPLRPSNHFQAYHSQANFAPFKGSGLIQEIASQPSTSGIHQFGMDEHQTCAQESGPALQGVGTFPRVMYREKRQSKEHQRGHQGQSDFGRMGEYQPLRRTPQQPPANQPQTSAHASQGKGGINQPNKGSRDQAYSAQSKHSGGGQGRRKHVHRDHAPRMNKTHLSGSGNNRKQHFAKQGFNDLQQPPLPQHASCIQILADDSLSKFDNHPVNAYPASNFAGPAPQGYPSVYGQAPPMQSLRSSRAFQNAPAKNQYDFCNEAAMSKPAYSRKTFPQKPKAPLHEHPQLVPMTPQALRMSQPAMFLPTGPQPYPVHAQAPLKPAMAHPHPQQPFVLSVDNSQPLMMRKELAPQDFAQMATQAAMFHPGPQMAPGMQVLSTPLRMKAQPAPAQPQQRQLPATPGTPAGRGSTKKAQSGTGSSAKQEKQYVPKQHQMTFECLTECTEWFLLAQVGNAQVRIPCSNKAVRFSDNKQELPILTKDLELFENLVRQEESLSASDGKVVVLNRPVNAGNNPSSSNNQSNGGYRKKEAVLAAQRDYDKQLKLNLVGDQDSAPLRNFPMQLPIGNQAEDATTRIVDLHLHHRTQQLMCLEFDLTHLKLAQAGLDDSSDEEAQQDGLMIGSGEAGADTTPFLGLSKQTGARCFGQPANVLYISPPNTVGRQLRLINQDYVDQTTYFSLNGECHGQLVFERDLKFQLQGKKVIKSIQERLIRAKDYVFNQIVRIDPGATSRPASSPRSDCKEAAERSRTSQPQAQPRPRQRTQKSVLLTLRHRNKKNKGPWLRRPDEIHIPIVNVTKSVGFKMLMTNLASIDNMLTNFNQIVMQEGVIQKYFFSFDLPVHQLSSRQPPVSNNLVVKVPKEQLGQPSQPGPSPFAPSPVKESDSTHTTGSGGPHLWNLVDEFKKLSAHQLSSHEVKSEATGAQGPPMQGGPLQGSARFSSNMVVSSAVSQGASSAHSHLPAQLMLAAVQGPQPGAGQSKGQVTFASSLGALSSHTSAHSQQQQQPQHAPLFMPGSQGGVNPHQVLYSLSSSFQPAPFSALEEARTYVPPEDPNYLSNLDRLLAAITPKVSPAALETTSVKGFLKSLKLASLYGLRVELLNEQSLNSEVFTFTPTLSSLVLSYTKPPEEGSPAGSAEGGSAESSSQRASGQRSQPAQSQAKFVEHHESEPHYQRPAFFAKASEILKEVPHLSRVLLRRPEFNFEASWFSVLWTCQRVCQVDLHGDGASHGGDDSTDCTSCAVTSIQFLAIHRFCPDPLLTGFHVGAGRPTEDTERQLPVQLVGLLPCKLDKESFWISPSHLQTDNELQGQLYDQICEENIDQLQGLKQRAIEFLQRLPSSESIHDFTHLLNSTNSSIFDLF